MLGLRVFFFWGGWGGDTFPGVVITTASSYLSILVRKGLEIVLKPN